MRTAPLWTDTARKEFAALMTLPVLVIGLTVVALLDQLMLRAGRAGLLPWRNSARQGQISATGFEQLHAPHRSTVDLDGGLAVIRLPGQ